MNTIICDSDYSQDWPIVDDEDVAQDISSWTFEAKCVRNCDSISLSSGSGISIIDGPNGSGDSTMGGTVAGQTFLEIEEWVSK